MGKRAFILILGFGMVTAGIAGITTSVVDQRSKAALAEFERVKEETRMEVAEEQKNLQQKREEIDRIANKLEEDRIRVEQTERRLTEEMKRTRQAGLDAQKRVALRAEKPAPEIQAKARPEDNRKRQAAFPKAGQEPRISKPSVESPRQPLARRAPGPDAPDRGKRGIEWISRKASHEAARSSEPVEYYNRERRERILAEPLEPVSPDSTRVRLRVWVNQRLVKDSVIRVDEFSSREQSMSQV